MFLTLTTQQYEIKQQLHRCMFYSYYYLHIFIIFINAFLLLDCGDPTPLNGVANTSSGTTETKIATISCNPGYNISGPTDITCLDGGWDFLPTCVIQGKNTRNCNFYKCDNTLYIHFKYFISGDKSKAPSASLNILR